MTEEQRALLNTPALSGSFPIYFKYGYTVTALDFACEQCNATIPFAGVHGRIRRSSSFMVDVVAIARCRCGKVNLQRIRLWDDMAFSVLNRDGEWEVGRVVITRKNRLRITAIKVLARLKKRLGLLS